MSGTPASGETVVRRSARGWVVGTEEASDLTSAMVLADLLAADLVSSGPTGAAASGATVPGSAAPGSGESPAGPTGAGPGAPPVTRGQPRGMPAP